MVQSARQFPAAHPSYTSTAGPVCRFACNANREAVGATPPARIEVDCQLNAAASLDNTFLKLVRNRLVLTIGAPLVVGLNTSQFAGVLAHEFGHFTQGAGMRLTYVIRSINHWFRFEPSMMHPTDALLQPQERKPEPPREIPLD